MAKKETRTLFRGLYRGVRGSDIFLNHSTTQFTSIPPKRVVAISPTTFGLAKLSVVSLPKKRRRRYAILPENIYKSKL